MTTTLRFDDVGLCFGERNVIEGLTLEAHPGRTVAVLGDSGSGKTSLLRMACGLQQPTSGRIDRAPGRIGYSFQEPRLLPWLSTVDNVLLPAGLPATTRDREHALSLLDEFGLDGTTHHRPAELSGGMRQRVSLARALLVRPALLLVDEALGSVERSARRPMALSTRRLAGDAVMLWVTHDPEEAAAMADHTIELRPPGGSPCGGLAHTFGDGS
ncbi:MAG: ATP-binding cassette domain-containing protein [Pseudonocardia sp.]